MAKNTPKQGRAILTKSGMNIKKIPSGFVDICIGVGLQPLPDELIIEQENLKSNGLEGEKLKKRPFGSLFGGVFVWHYV